MKDIRKQTIDLILKQDTLCSNVFGELLGDLLFLKNQIALLIDGNLRQCQLLYSDRIGFKNAFLLLTGVLSTIKSLESKGLVFINNNNETSLELYYGGKSDFYETQVPGEYKVADDILLQYKPSALACIKDSSTLSGTILPSSMYEEIERVFTSQIYPSKDLKDYVKRHYRTQDQQLAHRSLITAWIAIGVSLFIAIFPILIDLICD